MKKESKTVKSNKEVVALEERKARERKWKQEAMDRKKEMHRKYRHKIFQIIKNKKGLTVEQIYSAFSPGNSNWEECFFIAMAQLMKDEDIESYDGGFRTVYKKKCRYADEEVIVNVIKNYPGNTYDSLYSWSRLYKAEFDRVLGELENTKVIYQRKERYYIRKD
jgi:hypothetical protein